MQPHHLPPRLVINGVRTGSSGQVIVIVADVAVASGAHRPPVILEVMPVAFREGELTERPGRVLQERHQAPALEGSRGCRPGQFKEGWSNINGADDARTDLPAFDPGGPEGDERGFHTRIVQRGLVAGIGPAIVGDDDHQRIVGDVLAPQFLDHPADLQIETRDLIVVGGKILQVQVGCGVVGRQSNILRLMLHRQHAFGERAMRIPGGQPEKKRPVGRALFQECQPVIRTGGCSLADLNLPNQIKPVTDFIAQMPFAGGRRPISLVSEKFRHGDLFPGQGPVQLLRPGVVRIAAGQNAGTTGTAGTGGKVGIVETHPTLRHPVEVRGPDGGVTVGSEVILTHVICHDEDHVGAFAGDRAHSPSTGKQTERLDRPGRKQMFDEAAIVHDALLASRHSVLAAANRTVKVIASTCLTGSVQGCPPKSVARGGINSCAASREACRRE